MSAKDRVLERLQVGPATTAELCQPGVGGERFGGRLKELRDEGHTIDGRCLRAGSWLYTLRGLVAAPEAAVPPVAGRGLRAAGGGGHETHGLTRAWRCYRCTDHAAGGPVCPRGHQAERVWLIDLTRRVVHAPVHDDLAEAA